MVNKCVVPLNSEFKFHAFQLLFFSLGYCFSQMACQCYSHLPCLGGMLDRPMGVGRATGWTTQIHCLLASANGLLAQIYQGSETGTPIFSV